MTARRATGAPSWITPGVLRVALWGTGRHDPELTARCRRISDRGGVSFVRALSPDHRTLLLPDAPGLGQGILADLRTGTQRHAPGRDRVADPGWRVQPGRQPRRDQRRRWRGAAVGRQDGRARRHVRGPRRPRLACDLLRGQRSAHDAHGEPRWLDDQLGRDGIATPRPAVPCGFWLRRRCPITTSPDRRSLPARMDACSQRTTPPGSDPRRDHARRRSEAELVAARTARSTRPGRRMARGWR